MAYSKYRNRKCEIFGLTFDSISERDRYLVLLEMQQDGEIHHLECQPKFVLLPAFKDCEGNKERAITYKADFQYVDASGRVIVEDVKSVGTKASRDWSLRKKLFKHRFPDIALREVMA